MARRTETRFAGYDCVKLENGALALWVTQSVGPRVIGLALYGGENLFAEIPDVKRECPGNGSYSLRGGHRLWYAPEDPRRTYLPDDDPVAVTEVEDGICATQPAEPQTGVQKSLTVTLPDQGARVIVDHTLHNLGGEPIELAPWAITQLKPCGVAILPQATEPADEHGVLPNRHVVLWPYTRVNSPHIMWGDRFLLIKATMESRALKIGFPNPAGWLGYVLEGTLFVKHAPYQPDAAYFDRGSSSECYCDPHFLELETLGPRVDLPPGGSATHRETWTLRSEVCFSPYEIAAQRLAEGLGLTTGGGQT